MKFNMITDNMTRAFHKTGLKFKKHSPEIMVVAGVVGVVASTVMACKATTKVNFVLEETKRKVEIVHEGIEAGEVMSLDEENKEIMVPYSEEDGNKDLAYVYMHSGLKLAKLYAPAVAVGTLSIASILVGHRILHKRNIALAAAFTAVDKSFKEYRGRVLDRFGEAVDRELRYNIKAKEVVETVVDEEGNEKTMTSVVEVADPGYSEYTKCFDETCMGWQRDAERNMFFLKQQQNWANDKLKSQGYLFLNDVLKSLGIPVTKAGQVVGWIYDEKNPIGDNRVDFGIFNLNSEASRNFVNGYEKSIWLDFNVDGDILNML